MYTLFYVHMVTDGRLSEQADGPFQRPAAAMSRMRKRLRDPFFGGFTWAVVTRKVEEEEFKRYDTPSKSNLRAPSGTTNFADAIPSMERPKSSRRSSRPAEPAHAA